MNIIIAGDFTTEDRGMDAVIRGDAISEDIQLILREADYSIVNLEAPVVKSDYKPIIKSGPHLSTSPETISYLKKCGFHAVTLANNHFYDYGDDGVKLTIEELRRRSVDYVGGGKTDEEKKKILIKDIQDTRIAILNYCEHEFSINDGVGSNPLSEIDAYYDIIQAKSLADVIVLIVHGGSEGYQLPSPRMQKLYRFFIDIGADAVVNHHQHCYSGYERYNNGYIFYGLGNFFFDNKRENNTIWNEGYMVGLDIQDKSIFDFTLIPYKQCKNDCIQVNLMKGKEKESFYSSVEKLNSIIADDKHLNDEFISFCRKKGGDYLSAFTPYSNRYLRYLCKHKYLPSFLTKRKKLVISNYIGCESHRDITNHSLKYVLVHES